MKEVRVGIGVIIQKGDFILLGKRKNAHGEGTWCPPGGHLDFGESFEECVRREVLEETGLTLGVVRQGPTTNDIFEKEDKHYVTVFMVGEYLTGIPEVKEPDKCEAWEWFSWAALPQPLFLPMRHLIEQFIALQQEDAKV